MEPYRSSPGTLILLVCIALMALSCSRDLAGYADPLIGTAYTGHTFPGAARPFGFVQPGPHTGNFGWEHCSGYNNDDPRIWGFGQNHLTGTGIPDLGDLMMMPFSERSGPRFRSLWDKETEYAVPGYYSVSLTENDVNVEITCTKHTAVHRYHYEGASRNLYIDFQSAQTSSEHQYDTHVLDARVNFESPSTVTGYANVTGWVQRRYYYVIEFSSPVTGKEIVPGNPSNKAPKYVLRFGPGDNDIMVKVAMSTVGIDEARANLAAEVPGWNFDRVRSDARDEWNRYFRMIEISGTEEQKTNFYTSFYHLLLQPNDIADASGSYRGADDKVYRAESGHYYSTFSLWDTFRAAHPFYSLFMPDKASDMVNDMLVHSDVQGFLPIWALWGKENYCMIGNHAVPVVVDACLKNLAGVDKEAAYRAVKKSLTQPHYRSEWDIYDRYGYFPYDIIREESVSRTLECCYDDYCAAMLAGDLGYDEDYAFFMERAGFYRNLFDTENRLARGRDSKGAWRTPFDKFHLSHGGTSGGDYTEGNAWQYTWHIMHDIDGLVDLMGGRENFITKLDSLFIIDTKADVTGFVGDVTGLIGQYAHGNEPSHHVAYLYSAVGEGARTAEIVREIFDRFYSPRPDGLCGNDDCGQMSAWYMFSAMGFYPVDSISGEYIVGAPQIPYFKVKLPNGKVLKITAENLSESNRYVKNVTFNGIPAGNVITYSQIMSGGELRFEMTDKQCVHTEIY